MGEQVLCNCIVGPTVGEQKSQTSTNLFNTCKHIFMQEASFKYWPNKEESITFGNFSIELESDDPENKLIIRRIMKVTNVKEVACLFCLRD